MKIGNILINKSYIYIFAFLFLGICSLIGYSYINSDINYVSTITAKSYNCSQGNIYDRIACMSTPDSIKSKYVSSMFGMDFSNISSDTNGRGLYTLSSTLGDTYPVYYYRGDVTNNNVKFAGYCWKIVRTTSTGGTKLIYNGEPDNDGYCSNTTGDGTQIGVSNYNDYASSPAYSGYMYGTVYEIDSQELSSDYLYGNVFGFTDVDSNISGDGTYTLTTTTNDISNLNNYHYTCFNTTGECSEIKYIFHINNTTAYYIAIKDGKSVSDALDEMMQNNTDSAIKTYIDNWFETDFESYFTNNGKDYEDYIEDTIWCNDRNFREDSSGGSFENSGWNPNGGNNSVQLGFAALGRRNIIGVPTVECKNKKDAFTVNDTIKGNGLLTYPVGLLTADEIMMAGGQSVNNSTYYLYTNEKWLSMSPSNFFYDSGFGVFGIYNVGQLSGLGLSSPHGVRPSISLKNGVTISGGDGSSTSPYVIQ